VEILDSGVELKKMDEQGLSSFQQIGVKPNSAKAGRSMSFKRKGYLKLIPGVVLI
jgi:hypothetical protein